MLAAVIWSGCAGSGGSGGDPGARYRLEGQVVDEAGAPLRYAAVVLGGSPLGGVTSTDGRFDIDDLRPGRYGLTIIYLGFRSQPRVLDVPGVDEDAFLLPMRRDPSAGPAAADSLAPVQVTYRQTRQP